MLCAAAPVTDVSSNKMPSAVNANLLPYAISHLRRFCRRSSLHYLKGQTPAILSHIGPSWYGFWYHGMIILWARASFPITATDTRKSIINCVAHRARVYPL